MQQLRSLVGEQLHARRTGVGRGESDLTGIRQQRELAADVANPGLVAGLPGTDVMRVDQVGHPPAPRRWVVRRAFEDTVAGVLKRFRFRRRADFLLIVVDAGSAVLVSWLAYVLRFEGAPVPSDYVVKYMVAALVASFAYIPAARSSGLY